MQNIDKPHLLNSVYVLYLNYILRPYTIPFYSLKVCSVSMHLSYNYKLSTLFLILRHPSNYISRSSNVYVH